MPEHEKTWLTEIDHTGDLGIEVSADRVEDLFARAAWGMFSLICDISAVETRESRFITVQAADRDALMVTWLSELNFLHTTAMWLFCDFEVSELRDDRLVACAKGEPFDQERHTIYTELKAVTYHGLAIERHHGSLRARIIFDV